MLKFLVIQTAFLGDVILMTPVVMELKRIYPDSMVDVLVRKGNESVLLQYPAIDHLYILNKKEGKFKAIWQLIRRIRAVHYDEIINLHRFGSSGIITALSGAKKKTGFDKNPFSFTYQQRVRHIIGDGQHEVERNLSLIGAHGARKWLRPIVYPSKEDYECIAPYCIQPFVVIAPASVWFTKQLPEKKWIELIHQLKKKYEVWLVGGPDDRELCNRIAHAAALKGQQVLAGKLSLLQSCALFARAQRCYVNDSGPLHMASAVNAPTTVFFCSTIPDFGFGPLSDDSKVIEIDYALECRPCGLHGYKTCPKGHFKCGYDILTNETR